ncbi:amino acid ABC transporter permease [Marinivivus vitaminiproducens]|uniref:amino acid ABC transporter permease n=1 Tax=Marinivivus vitaminiproducens TaxID=3035935 RepID=UPI0027A1C332|nr:amino acid ABC transporter permease [Geminicoccaceae bacterium SCSIO 64248]
MATQTENIPFNAGDSLPPPAATTGVVGWVRQNLFSSPFNALLTLAALYLLWLTVPPALNWLIFDATFTGDTPEACAATTGACWSYVNARAGQIFFGFYPPDERWRILVALIILVAAFVPFFVRTFEAKLSYAVGLLIVYPIIAYILFAGGAFGLEAVPTRDWGGLFLTLVIAGVGITASLPLGILLALGRRSEMPVVRILCVTFIELVRGVPLITVLFMASVMLPLFLPPGVNFDKLLRALVGFSLFSAAYMAEVVRGGLQAMPKGQYEAASALGLSYWQSMGLIILPQALRMVIPGIVNTFIGLFKDTTLVIIIGLFDFLNATQSGTNDANWIGRSMEAYAFAAMIYWVFCFAMSRYSIHLENKLNRGRQH